MVRKFVSATVSAALCFASAAPALAQEYRFTGFDAPRGTSATFNLRVPLTRERGHRPSYGLNIGWGRTTALPTMDGRTMTRAVNLAEVRFSGDELRRAQVLGFDVRDPAAQGRRLGLTGDSGNTLWIVVGLVAAGVAICLLADCFEGDDDSDSSSN